MKRVPLYVAAAVVGSIGMALVLLTLQLLILVPWLSGRL